MVYKLFSEKNSSDINNDNMSDEQLAKKIYTNQLLETLIEENYTHGF